MIRLYEFKSQWYFVIGSILFWMLLFTYFVLMRTYGIETLPNYEKVVEYSVSRAIFMGILMGGTIGVLYNIMELFTESKAFYCKPLIVIILLKTFLMVLITLLAMSLVIFFQKDYLSEVIKESGGTLSVDYFIEGSTNIFLALAASMFGALLLNFFKAVQSKTGGPKEFMSLMTGRYRNPKEQHRIFMFLDLKSSTTHAERLGHKMYSRLIQNCFEDLTYTVIEHDAEIYQYVGDEAVLTWETEKGLPNAKCIKAYYHFKEQLESRADYYKATFGVVPEFKASLNMGNVMVAEVGILKREIAYHSDVLNTASRIQELCNVYKEPLLVSNLIKDAVSKQFFAFKLIADVTLRGKSESVKVFAVEGNYSNQTL